MAKARKPRGKGAEWAILYETGVEFASGERIVANQGKPEQGRLPAGVLEALRSQPPPQTVIVADPLLTNVADSAAKAVPLGQGEAIWLLEVQRNWGIEPSAFTARHHPVRTGAMVAVLAKEDMQTIFRSKRLPQRIIALPLLLAHIAAHLDAPGFAVFLRRGYLWLGIGDGREVVDVVFIPAGHDWNATLLRAEMELQKNLVGGRYEKVVFVESVPPEGFSAPSVEVKRFTDLNPPPELFWVRATQPQVPLLPTAYAAGLTVVLGLGLQVFLGGRLGALEKELFALEAEAVRIRQQIQTGSALKQRVAELEAILRTTSTESPLFRTLERIVEGVPPGVLVSNLSLHEKDLRLRAHSESVKSLSELATSIGKAVATPPTTLTIREDDKGWKKADMAFTLSKREGSSGQ